MRASEATVIEVFTPSVEQSSNPCSIPMYADHIEAGFPSPAQDYVDQCMDLNELCIRHPATAFFVRVKGDSMVEGGIGDGDVLIVEGSIDPRHGDIVIACIDDSLTVKRLEIHPEARLVPMNVAYRPIAITPDNETNIVGVVTNVIHPLR
ncbi:MAG: translesion error-prone DNA polymerase V autoproteolytic subunit [Desulfuromonadaceae bacterium]